MRARAVLAAGARTLRETAKGIRDPELREGYLRGYLDHARLLTAFEARGL